MFFTKSTDRAKGSNSNLFGWGSSQLAVGNKCYKQEMNVICFGKNNLKAQAKYT